MNIVPHYFLQKKNRFDSDYQSGWHAKRDSNPYYPKSFSMLSAIRTLNSSIADGKVC